MEIENNRNSNEDKAKSTQIVKTFALKNKQHKNAQINNVVSFFKMIEKRTAHHYRETDSIH